MAQQAPNCVEVLEIKFNLHDKYVLFNTGQTLRSHVSLMAVSSSQGLLFVGHPNEAEMRVLMHKELVDAQGDRTKLRMRSLALPGLPVAMACSADGSMLAVNFVQNGSSLLQIYSVASFLTPTIKLLYLIRLSTEEGINARHLLWNPVLNGSIAVVLNNGALGMYALKDGGQYEFHSLDQSQQVKCGCWSPKGKQIVLGFPNGRLQQFKPDLTPAKTIECPAGVHQGPFDTIAVHWLSTFQFAAVFAQQGDETTPALYIVNAPKGAAPSYVNYFDICYSSSGPRQHQVMFTHIAPWNLLLVVSANAVEVGVLGTNEAGDTPNWVQYSLHDDSRIEMPMIGDDETFPVGFTISTCSTHQLVIEESQIAVMPMAHVLSTHGHLLNFNLLNLAAGAAGICSPPPPLNDTSGHFRLLEEPGQATATPSQTPPPQQPEATAAPAAERMSFGFGASATTSTPAMKEKPTPLFAAAAPASGSLFGQQASTSTFAASTFASNSAAAKPPSLFGGFGLGGNNNATPPSQFGTPSASPTPGFKGFSALGTGATTAAAPPPAFGGFGAATGKNGETAVPAAQPAAAAPQSQPPPQSQPAVTVGQKAPSDELSKPLYTVPSTFNPPAAGAQPQSQQQQQQQKPATPVKAKPQMPSDEVDEVVKQMMAIQVQAFSQELAKVSEHSNSLLTNLGDPAEMKQVTRRLNDLREVMDQAGDRDFEMDVLNLRHSLNESYAMLAECRSKLEMFENPDITRLTSISMFDPINRRQLRKLESYLATNEAQLQQLQQLIDEQWACYQEVVRRNTRHQMHIPCMDGIYQRMAKLRNMVAIQRTKIDSIKTVLKQTGLLYKPLANGNGRNSTATSRSGADENTMESIADTILSMSLMSVVDEKRALLSKEKLDAIREFTKRQKHITIIRPQRPDRIGLRSEVILESKMQSESRARAGAATNVARMQQQKLEKVKSQGSGVVGTTATETSNASPPATTLAKPTATKPTLPALQSFAAPTQAPSIAPNFNVAGTSPFVKTAAATPALKANDDAAKAAVPTTPSFFATPPNFGGFGIGGTSAAGSGFASTQPQPTFSAQTTRAAPAESLKEALAAPPQMPMQTPISFAAKVIGGDSAKPMASVPTSPAANVGFATLAATAAPKPAAAPSTDKENKKPEEKPKITFNFGGSSAANAAETPASGGFLAKSAAVKAAPFAGLGASLAATTTTAEATTSNTPSTTFSFIHAMKESTEGTPKPPIFSGFLKAAGEAAVTTAASPVSAANTSFSFNALNLSAPTTATTSTTDKAPLTTDAPTDTFADISTPPSELPEELFGSLSVCKPTTKEEQGAPKDTTPANVFSGLGTGGGNGSVFSFASGDSPFAGTKSSLFGSNGNAVGQAAVAAAEPAKGDTAVASTAPTTVTSTAPASVASTTVSPSGASPKTTFSFVQEAYGGTGPAAAGGDGAAAATPAAPSSGSIFGGTAAAPLTAATPSIFGAAATTSAFGAAPPATSNASAFGAAATATSNATTASPFGVQPTTVATATTPPSIFGGAAAAAPPKSPPSTNIFGGIPKPDQSAFASPPTATSPPVGLFAAAAAANPMTFAGGKPLGAGPTPVSGGSLFGGSGAVGFGAAPAAGGSIFGGNVGTFGAAAVPNANATSIFGGAAKPPEGASLFNSSAQAGATASSGGSLFTQSAFGQQPVSGGSLFGSTSPTQASPAPGGFGSGGSIFGGGGASSTPAVSGGSIFGGNAQSALAPSVFGGGGSGGFGSFASPPTSAAPPFGTPSSGGGAFAQGGGSVAQTGFGSPPAGGSAFSKPLFGGTPSFGSPPAFGTQPSFGGAATFGSPKGFGFGTPTAGTLGATAFNSPPTQKNNLFEALGSTDQGLSFGNLAQTTSNAQKPSFGGSSFMNYRA